MRRYQYAATRQISEVRRGGIELDVRIQREDAEQFIEEVRGDDPESRELLADRGARARGRAVIDDALSPDAHSATREGRRA